NLFGKAAIVKAILEGERGSKLAIVRDNDGRESFRPEKLANTWFLKFMYMLGRGIPKAEIKKLFANVSFIIFNYDRCVEDFLYHGLQKLYGIQEDEAAELVGSLNVIHPFGQVGAYLPIGRSVPFGTSSANYRALADGIKTYTEQLGAKELKTRITVELQRA